MAFEVRKIDVDEVEVEVEEVDNAEIPTLYTIVPSGWKSP